MSTLRRYFSTYGSFAIVVMIVVAAVVVSGAANGTELSGFVTFYSEPDNSPPGSRTLSYPGLAPRHRYAGGTGTYEDPQTFASARTDVYAPGTMIYVPRFQRYFVMEDLCDCSHGTNHVDLWLEPSGTDVEVLACEKLLTRRETIIKEPDPNLPVDLTPLISNGTCRVP